MTTGASASVPTVADIERLARTELSLPARIGHVTLALVASAMTTIVTSLLLTEPALPGRTRAAFAVLAAIGLGWVAFSAWVLRTRRVMLARHRVVAGRLAVTFTGVFAAGCLLFALTTRMPAAWPASAMSCSLLVAAVVLWHRAEADHARLLARRVQLEHDVRR